MSLVKIDKNNTWVDAEAVVAIEADGLSDAYSLVTLENHNERVVVNNTADNVARIVNDKLAPSPRWSHGGQYV